MYAIRSYYGSHIANLSVASLGDNDDAVVITLADLIAILSNPRLRH